jgi:hypothetical protein
MLDTTPESQERYFELLRRSSPQERGRTAFALTDLVRRLAEAGIRLQHPGISAQDLKKRLAVRLYGRKVAMRLCGNIPADAR